MAIENTRPTASCLNQHPHFRHSENQKLMPSLLPISADVSMVPKSEVPTISDWNEPATKKPRRHYTEGSCEGSLGDRGKRQRWKPWHRCCRRAQEAELLRGIDSSHKSDAHTAPAKRARHQNLVRRRVRHLHRLQPAERSDGGKRPKRKPTTTQATHWDHRSSGLGGVWSKDSSRKERSWERYWRRMLSIEERCGMVKHCRTRLSSHSSAGSLSP